MIEVNPKQVPGKVKLFRFAGAAAIIGGLALSLPVIYSAFLAGLGLIGLAITAGIGIGLAKALPYLGQVAENRLIKARIAEAAANPIETRIQIAMQRRKELEAAKAEHAKNEGRINSTQRDIKDFKAKFPNGDVSDFEAALASMKQVHSRMGEAINVGAQRLVQYEETTEMLAAKLRLALGVQDLAQAMNLGSVQKAYDKLLSDTATRSVDESFDQSMAQLTRVMDEARSTYVTDPLLGPPSTAPMAALDAPAQESVAVGARRAEG